MGLFLRLQVLCYIVAIFLRFITMEKEARPEYKPVPPIIETPPIKYINGEDKKDLGSDRDVAAFSIIIAFCIGLLIGLFLCN